MSSKEYEELIPERIFIGSIGAIQELLENENIDVIYDLRAEVNGTLSSNISIHQPISDDNDYQDESIKKAVKEVVNSYHAGKNIYFHCNTGRGRAGTIAAATLMELKKLNSIDEAEMKAKEIRPQINIRPQFKEALKRIYEK